MRKTNAFLILTIIAIMIGSVVLFLDNSQSLVDHYHMHDNDLHGAQIHANHIKYESVEELMDNVELVIIVNYFGKSENVAVQQENENEHALPIVMGYTISEVRINKVIKANESKDHKEKELINIVEPNFYIEENGNKTEYTWEGYTNLEDNGRCVLFLNWSEDKQLYEVHSLYHGKINIDGKDKAEEALAHHNPQFDKLRKEAMGLFKNSN